jgi:hypothetical protein
LSFWVFNANAGAPLLAPGVVFLAVVDGFAAADAAVLGFAGVVAAGVWASELPSIMATANMVVVIVRGFGMSHCHIA